LRFQNNAKHYLPYSVGSPFLVQFKNRLFFIFFNYLFFYDLKELSGAKA